MHVWIWMLTGIALGSAAHALGKSRAGLAGGAVLGALGGVAGGWLARLGGLDVWGLGFASEIAAVAGAGALLGGVRLLRTLTEAAVTRAPAVVDAVRRRVRPGTVARDTNLEFERQLSFGDRMADRLAELGGSWLFVGLFLTAMLAWIAYNVERPRSFDPYPFILLNLMLSCLAALQAPVIMMSQNRFAAKDRLDARHDYEVNLKAETEIMDLHAKLDTLAKSEWSRLLELQREQIAALERIERALVSRAGGAPGGAPSE
jgi:uncharacterized membrane protein